MRKKTTKKPQPNPDDIIIAILYILGDKIKINKKIFYDTISSYSDNPMFNQFSKHPQYLDISELDKIFSYLKVSGGIYTLMPECSYFMVSHHLAGEYGKNILNEFYDDAEIVLYKVVVDILKNMLNHNQEGKES